MRELAAYTTISVSEETKRRLLEVSADLQRKTGQKVDYDAAIAYLVSSSRRSKALLIEACAPLGTTSRELREALSEGRREDELREESFELR